MPKIVGNTVGIPNPQSDWNQTDPTKADYIKNKPEGLATENYVDTHIAALVDTAPDELNTFKELAEALGNDPNYATTIMTKLENKVDKEEGKGLSTNDYSDEEKEKLAGLKNIEIVDDLISTDKDKALSANQGRELFNTIGGINTSVSNQLIEHTDNNEIHVTEREKTAWNAKVDKIDGKGLSTNDFTNEEKEKLAGLGEYDDTELKLRDERLQYYGDPEVVPTDASYFTFTTDDTTMTASISKGSNIDSLTAIAIPYKYIDTNGNEYTVTSIGNDAFKSCQNLTDIIIPNGVTNIGDNAFSGCSGLISITIPNSVTSLGSGAFSSCTSLTSVTMSNSITSLKLSTFQTCTSLTNIIIPDSVTSFENAVFWDCTNLTNITIPNSVTNIPSSVFGHCPNVTIHCYEDSVADQYAQANNISVSYIYDFTINYVKLRDERLKYYGDPDIVSSDASYFTFTTDDETMTASISKGNNINELTEIVIPYKYIDEDTKKEYKITSIEKNAFVDCLAFSNMTIPYSVISIGNNAFRQCSGLANITIPDSVITIGVGIFYGCSWLKSIIIPDSVTSIPTGTFNGCTNLANITIPDSVTSIGNSAFSSCSSLTDIIIPDSVTSIGNTIFASVPDVKIHCYKGSVAEEYAVTNNIPYILLDADIVTSVESTTILLKNQQDLRLQELTGDYTLYLPDIVSNAYESSLTFTAGEGLILSYSSLPIIWRGEDCDSEGNFIPETNKMYEISIKKINEKTLEDGTIEPVIVARVGEV